jgi:hypothetical protein
MPIPQNLLKYAEEPNADAERRRLEECVRINKRSEEWAAQIRREHVMPRPPRTPDEQMINNRGLERGATVPHRALGAADIGRRQAAGCASRRGTS